MPGVFSTPGASQPGLAGYGPGPDIGALAAPAFATSVPAGASLDLQFAGTGALDSRITYTGGGGSYFNSAGAITAAVTNVARFDFDPVTLAARGLLMEESRTNLLLNSATLATQSVTTAATAYVLSFYGTGTVTLSGTSTAGPLVGTGAFPARVSLAFTPSAGTLTLTVSGSVLHAQLEAGSFATSYIPTTAAAATRTADLATMPLGSWFNAAAGTLAVEGQYPYTVTAGLYPALLSLDTGASSNELTLFDASGSLCVQNIVGGSNVHTTYGAASTTLPCKLAAAYGAASVNGAANGSVALADASRTIAASMTTLRLGGSPGPAYWANGYVRRVRYWPRALAAQELAAVTT